MTYVISHMMMTIDGKTSGECLCIKESEETTKQYFDMHLEFEKDAYAMGRNTYLEGYTDYKVNLAEFENKNENIDYSDYVSNYVKKNKNKKIMYAIAYDGKGMIGWKSNLMENEAYNKFKGYKGAHIIEVLTEDTSLAYLLYLRSRDISYIFAGPKEDAMDISLSLNKLNTLFSIKKIILEGGSTLNGGFLNADKINELNILITPVSGEKGANPLFIGETIRTFKLEKCDSVKGVVRLRYKRSKKDEEKNEI